MSERTTLRDDVETDAEAVATWLKGSTLVQSLENAAKAARKSLLRGNGSFLPGTARDTSRLDGLCRSTSLPLSF